MSYIPILKARASEIGALRDLDKSIRDHLTPVLVFPLLPENLRKVSPEEIHEKYLTQLVANLSYDWPFERPVYIDLQCMDQRINENVLLAEIAFDALFEKNIQFVPVLSLHCPDGFKKLVSEVGKKNKRGYCLYINDNDYGVENLLRPINGMLEDLRCEPEEIDLILDYKTVVESQRNALFASVIYRLSGLPYLERWRNLALAAVSYPYNITHLSHGMIEIPRVEWRLWEQLRKTKIKRMPLFADYDTFHPLHPDIDPKKNPDINRLRYTVDGKWLILNEVDMDKMNTEKLIAHCRDLVESEDFCGKEFSWGDKFIYDCAYHHADVNPDSTELWKKACTSHHLSFVVRQLSR